MMFAGFSAPFSLSLSKGNGCMLRQAQHERNSKPYVQLSAGQYTRLVLPFFNVGQIYLSPESHLIIFYYSNTAQVFYALCELQCRRDIVN